MSLMVSLLWLSFIVLESVFEALDVWIDVACLNKYDSG